MNTTATDLQQALTEVSASSAGGAPFLLAYGATFLITAFLSYILPKETTALIALFQGGVALPLAFWSERRMGLTRMAANNPLRPLSAQLAMSQALGLPLLIAVYDLNPGAIPLALAALGGVHFLPYAWLQRTNIYAFLAVAVAIGAFVLQMALGTGAFAVILFYVALVYWITALLVYRQAMRLVTGSRS